LIERSATMPREIYTSPEYSFGLAASLHQANGPEGSLAVSNLTERSFKMPVLRIFRP
jgi:hypothetical protein